MYWNKATLFPVIFKKSSQVTNFKQVQNAKYNEKWFNVDGQISFSIHHGHELNLYPKAGLLSIFGHI